MTTFADLVSQVRQQLMGFTKNQESITYLNQPMTDTDITFTVDTETVNNVSRGLVEIDDEMLLVKKYDRASGVVTVMADIMGRGREGTVAAAHDALSIVTMDPEFPVARIREAINATITSTYPDLFTFAEYEFPKNAAQFEYPLPVDCEGVYKVTADTIGPSKIWFPVQRWRFNNRASMNPVEGSPTGRSLQVMDDIVPGRTIRVVYTRPPQRLVLPDDDFEFATGYPERYVDMIMYGTVARMLPALEAGRLQQSSIESSERSQVVPTQAASQASQYFWNLYYRRLDEERRRLHVINEEYTNYLT